MRCFIAALQFLTRIQIKKNLWIDDEIFGKSVAYFPLVGLVIGVISAGSAYVLSLFFPPLIVAVSLLCLSVFLSGALHLDGFMDTLDGLYSGRSQDRILEIMRDSRVGAHSVVSLLCLFLLKFSFLVSYPRPDLIPILILLPVFSRLTAVLNIYHFPYVREEGLAKCFHTYTGKRQLCLALFFALLPILLAPFLGMLFLVFTYLTTLLLGRYVTKKLGGLTGDVYGAIIEIMELLLLILGYIFASFCIG